MAAKIVVIRDEKKWEVIGEFLAALEQGGIVVPPETVERLDENKPGWEDELGSYIDYDFGGEAEIFVDIACNGNMADEALDEVLIG